MTIATVQDLESYSQQDLLNTPENMRHKEKRSGN